MGDYSKLTDEMFNDILSKLCEEDGIENLIFSVPSVYEAVSEYYNNDVLKYYYDNIYNHDENDGDTK